MKILFTLLFTFGAWSMYAQTITGNVLDATTGTPIAGATVTLLNTPNGTTTDTDGRFSLNGTGTGVVCGI